MNLVYQYMAISLFFKPYICIVQVLINYLLFYRNIQCFTIAMPFNMILMLYVIPCKLSCDFSKLIILYIYMYIYSIIFMTNKSVMTFLYVNKYLTLLSNHLHPLQGGGPRVVVSTAAFHARVRGSVPGLGGLKETKMFLPHPRVKVSIAGSLRDREVACSASDRQGSNFESCVWRTVSSQLSQHPQEVLLAQFSLYVHKGGLKPDSFHFKSLDNTAPYMSCWYIS